MHAGKSDADYVEWCLLLLLLMFLSTHSFLNPIVYTLLVVLILGVSRHLRV